MRFCISWKFEMVPPSPGPAAYGAPILSAAFAIASATSDLPPTKRTTLPSFASAARASFAAASCSSVFARSRISSLERAPRTNGFIEGCRRLLACAKCAPVSNRRPTSDPFVSATMVAPLYGNAGRFASGERFSRALRRGLFSRAPERFHDVAYSARHDRRQIVPALFDAMVGHTVLKEIVGAYLLGAVGGADLLLALSGMLFRRLFFMQLFELCGEDLHRLLAIGFL